MRNTHTLNHSHNRFQREGKSEDEERGEDLSESQNNYQAPIRSSQAKDQSNLLESSSRLPLKENNWFGVLNSSFRADSSRQGNTERVEDLRRKRRHHSKELLSLFQREIEQMEQGECSGKDVQSWVKRLDMAIWMIKQMGHLSAAGINLSDMNCTERMFAQKQIAALYETRLDQKEQELREMTRLYNQLKSKVKMEKEGQRSALKRNIRSHIEEIHGPASVRGSVENSRLTISGKDLFGAGGNSSVWLALNNSGERYSNQKRVRCSFEVEDQRMAEGLKDESGDLVVEWEEMGLERVHQGSEEKGFQTGRFGGELEEELRLVVTSEEKWNRQKCISVNRLQGVTVSPIGEDIKKEAKDRGVDAGTQTGDVGEEKSENRLRRDTAETEAGKSREGRCPVRLSQISQVINATVFPNPSQRERLSIHPQYSLSVNGEIMGARLKGFKCLVKMVLCMVSECWRVVSRVQKECKDGEMRESLKGVSGRIDVFIRKFNMSYSVGKAQGVGEVFYQQSTKGLREIEECMLALLKHRMQ